MKQSPPGSPWRKPLFGMGTIRRNTRTAFIWPAWQRYGAVDTLDELLVCPCGPNDVRLELEPWLQQNFFIEAGKPTKLLLSGEVQEATMQSVALHSIQRDLGLPAAVQTRLKQTFRLLRKIMRWRS